MGEESKKGVKLGNELGGRQAAEFFEFKRVEKVWSNKRVASIGKSSCIKVPTKVAAAALEARRRFLSTLQKKAAETGISAAFKVKLRPL